MAEFNDLTEKMENVHVTEPDLSASNIIQNESLSNTAEKLEENDTESMKDNNSSVSPDVKGAVADNKSETEGGAPISSDIPNSSNLNDEQAMQEIDKGKEEVTVTDSDIQEFLEQMNDESVFVESLLTGIQMNLLSECNTNIDEREKMIWDLTLKTRRKAHVAVTSLQHRLLKLVRQKRKLLVVKNEILRNKLRALMNARVTDINEVLERIAEETLNSFFEHKDVYVRFKCFYQDFVQNIEEKLDVKNVPRTILEEQKAFFSMLENISPYKISLESSINASEEFEILMKKCIEAFTESPLNRYNYLIDAVDKMFFACTEMKSLGYMIAKLFDCIEFCVRVTNQQTNIFD